MFDKTSAGRESIVAVFPNVMYYDGSHPMRRVEAWSNTAASVPDAGAAQLQLAGPGDGGRVLAPRHRRHQPWHHLSRSGQGFGEIQNKMFKAPKNAEWTRTPLAQVSCPCCKTRICWNPTLAQYSGRSLAGCRPPPRSWSPPTPCSRSPPRPWGEAAGGQTLAASWQYGACFWLMVVRLK